jgi:hypothetical protein
MNVMQEKNHLVFRSDRIIKYRIMVLLMQVTELSRVHDNGEMDIKTQGLKIFRIWK